MLSLAAPFVQGSRILRANGDRNGGKYDRWKNSRRGKEGKEGSQQKPQSQPGQRRPIRPRTNIPPPRTISMNPSGSFSPVPPPPEPPPDPPGNPLGSIMYKTISAFPGFRDITNDPMENWFEDNPRRRSPAYGDWAADIEVGDDWDYRPGGSDFKYQADSRARYPNTNTPRDSFMRPIADPIGVADRCDSSIMQCVLVARTEGQVAPAACWHGPEWHKLSSSRRCYVHAAIAIEYTKLLVDSVLNTAFQLGGSCSTCLDTACPATSHLRERWAAGTDHSMVSAKAYNVCMLAMRVVVACRLSFDRVSRERRLGEEAFLNRQESRVALVFAGLWLFLIPFGFGFFVSRGLAEPLITFTQARPSFVHSSTTPPSCHTTIYLNMLPKIVDLV